MGYGDNPDIVTQRAELLAPLKTGKPCVWETDKNHRATRRLEFKIREGLRIAGRYPLRFPELADAANKYRISIVKDGRIEAHPRAEEKVETSTLEFDNASPIHGVEGFGRTPTQVGASTADEVIASWQAHLPSNDAIHFKDTLLPEEELVKLWQWAQSRQPKLMLVVATRSRVLSVSLPEIGQNKLIGWHPPGVKIEEETLDV